MKQHPVAFAQRQMAVAGVQRTASYVWSPRTYIIRKEKKRREEKSSFKIILIEIFCTNP